jgi:ComF family protein
MLELLKSIFFQSRCDVCGQIVAGSVFLCRDCMAALSPVQKGFCPFCGRVYAEGDAIYGCGQCRQKLPPWTGLGFYGLYAGLLQQLVLEYKFSHRLVLGKVLVFLLYQAYKVHGLEQPDLIVPVPVHWKRLRARGFNHCLELAKLLAPQIGAALVRDALVKIKHTPPQVELTARERKSNLKDSFQVVLNKVQGKKILLVDDVMTTGTTLQECTLALVQGGAKQVQVLFLARAG